MSDFYFPVSNQLMEKSIAQAVVYLAEDRQKLIFTHLENSTKLVSLLRDSKVKNVLNAAGKASLIYFQLRQQGKIKVGNLTHGDVRSLARFMVIRNLDSAILTAVSLNVTAPSDEDKFLYWAGGLKQLSKITSRDFRSSQETWQPICVYKTGPVLTPNENLSWTLKLKRLTSTRHKNVLLKISAW